MFLKPAHSLQNIFQNQTKQTKNGVAHGGVVQDSGGGGRVRAASDEPVMDAGSARTSVSNTTIPRTKKRSTKRRLYQLATWVEDPIVLQIKDLARAHKPERLSISETIRALLLEILQQKFEKAHAATLPTIIMHAVARAARALSDRLTYFAMRNALAAEQTLILQIDLYKRQLQKDGVPSEKIQEKLDRSNEMAHKNVLIMTPKLKKLVAQWDALFPLEREDRGKGGTAT